MNDKEIILKVIKKYNNKQQKFKAKCFCDGESIEMIDNDYGSLLNEYISFTDFLFDNYYGFAKAFWGNRKHIVLSDNGLALAKLLPVYSEAKLKVYELPIWKICLQQMVLEREPLKYLEEFL